MVLTLSACVQKTAFLHERLQVAPDKDPERKFLPPPESLTDKLLLADRGYQSLDYWEEVDAAGGFFLVRGKSNLNP